NAWSRSWLCTHPNSRTASAGVASGAEVSRWVVSRRAMTSRCRTLPASHTPTTFCPRFFGTQPYQGTTPFRSKNSPVGRRGSPERVCWVHPGQPWYVVEVRVQADDRVEAADERSSRVHRIPSPELSLF